jgi:hypothetical protein
MGTAAQFGIDSAHQFGWNSKPELLTACIFN